MTNYSISQSTIEINKENLLNNFKFFKNLGNTKEVYPVIKANAYGHGIGEIVQCLDKVADGYSIHSVNELDGFNTKKPVLVLGFYNILNEKLISYIKNNKLIFTVFDYENLEKLSYCAKKAKKEIKVYIKLETGTNRLGVDLNTAKGLLSKIRENQYMNFQGFSMHFANIEDTTDHSFAKSQLDKFGKMAKDIANSDNFKMISACSAAALLFEDTRMDIVRLGISLYGYFSSKETLVSYKSIKNNGGFPLTPVLSWVTNILQIKSVKKGEYIGYGLTYKANLNMKIAILPVGYSDGIDRKLSNCGYVLIEEQRAPICGRVCMNLTMVDVSHIENIKKDSNVVLIGKSGDEEITANTIAELTGSINYQILASLNPMIPRKVV